MDSEVFAFMDVLKTVTRVFPIRGDEHDVQQLGMAYFKALRRYPLAQVKAAAETCIERGKHFPKPAEWLDQIPRAQTVPTAEAEELSEADAYAYQRAERLRYDDEPCRCEACRSAGVSDRPVRFVPETTADGLDRRVRDPLSGRIVVAGHWAHGTELAGYYASKEAFYGKFQKAVADHSMTSRATKTQSVQDRILAAFKRRGASQIQQTPPDRIPGEDDGA